MSQNQKTIAENRKARHEYELYDRFEAGLVLQGTEIKSIRRGKVQLKDSYISFQKGEAFIKGMHISPYEFGKVKIFMISVSLKRRRMRKERFKRP